MIMAGMPWVLRSFLWSCCGNAAALPHWGALSTPCGGRPSSIPRYAIQFKKLHLQDFDTFKCDCCIMVRWGSCDVGCDCQMSVKIWRCRENAGDRSRTYVIPRCSSVTKAHCGQAVNLFIINWLLFQVQLLLSYIYVLSLRLVLFFTLLIMPLF